MLSERTRALFWKKVNLPDERGCMLWMASQNGTGYGVFGVNRKNAYAHRVSYELAYGPISTGLVIDHLCRVRSCVNPSHLEAVTQEENIRRGASGQAQRARTHCPSGHAYDAANTVINKRGHRTCRACRRRWRREWRQRVKR